MGRGGVPGKGRRKNSAASEKHQSSRADVGGGVRAACHCAEWQLSDGRVERDHLIGIRMIALTVSSCRTSEANERSI